MQTGDDVLYRMTPLEIARGFVLDDDPARRVRPASSPPPDPRTVLEECLLRALEYQPCVVAFSGGRDSSVLLALAVRVARREGVPLPVPVTRRFPRFEDTREDEWQELVIQHLGVEEWVRVDLDDDALDLIGPVAGPRVREHGVLWPPLLHQDEPAVAHALGGAVIDGEGGDQVFGLDIHRIAPLVLAHRFPRYRAMRRLPGVAAALVPDPGQRAVSYHRLRTLEAEMPWLREAAMADLRRDLAREHGALPLRWDQSIRGLLHHRARRLGLGNRTELARRRRVEYIHPFLEPRFLESLARAGGPTSLGPRSEAMTSLFSDLLPRAVLRRRTKASFNPVVHGRFSREFAEQWDGSGVDERLVDLDRLHEEWRSPAPNGRTHALLQAAWRHSQLGSA
ncbi:hypothetical protein ER308_12320 [Egibacter rhizosphaerae]|uniref:Asparagine synthetase domain-containing protein n=1 Tax=Egibacter rhizosphaerae TaxID=1670831 RepID=A0A411YG77_9ACTN|nr:asparagine synthase-related protein [Egibacter rhizosphaerae]QBI20274.1 hypothetical protein ER308_12320 [Egibacter rhizosphaerae]